MPRMALGMAPSPRQRRGRGFTLIELLAVVGIVAVLIALLLPAMIAARKQAQTIQCAANLRQLTAALLNYSVESKGAFPPNSADIDQYWFTDSILGRYIRSSIPMPDGTIAGGVLVCPGDLEGAIRSYSVKFFSSSYISAGPRAALDGPNPPGRLFKAGAKESSSLILAIESFSSWEAPGHEPDLPDASPLGFTPNAIIGFYRGTPGERFGAGDGAAAFPGGRFGDATACQVCYFRHRNTKTNRLITDAFGRTNIGFVDGHVATFSHDDLADFKTGASRFNAMWSPIDRAVESAAP
jgi:prepilin-type N-terminal cleavage/methylation domain-containing protein/prepilin-type processing-associated H-X9-DG protein